MRQRFIIVKLLLADAALEYFFEPPKPLRTMYHTKKHKENGQ